MSFEPILDCWYLTGATASGKSSVALELARRLDAEILSLDSMALYRGMDIGTAKPTPDELAAAPHHFVDMIDPDEDFSVARYCEAARRIVDDLRAAGKTPLFVGGTPLYLKSLLRGIYEAPAADEAVRDRLTAEGEALGPGKLHERLRGIDPAAAERIHPNDTRRVVRALEVFETTGRPISEQQQEFDRPRATADDLRVFVIKWPRPVMHERINRRVDRMFEEGLVEEVRGLVERFHPLSRTARQAVGYREVIEHLEGRHDLARTIELVKAHTRQLAKRQETWFRSLQECRFIHVSEPLDPIATAERILREGSL